MRTRIELPDHLLMQAKSKAALLGISVGEFFFVAVKQQLRSENCKVRQAPPAVGDKRHGPRIGVTAEIDEAMFG